MSDRDNSATKQLDAVLNSLQRSLLEATDEEIVKELQAAEVDPLKAMEVMSFADERAVDDHFRRVRERIANLRSESMKEIYACRGRLPASRVEQLDLLRTVCTKHAQILTAQFRELTSLDKLGDAELASMLQHLEALGFLRSED